MIALRPYQTRAVDAILKTAGRRKIVKSPAGSGKTILGAASIDLWAGPRRRLSGRRMDVRWIANSEEQCDQARKAVAKFPTIAENCTVTVGCYQGMPDVSAADLVVLDECQHAGSPEYRKIIDGYGGHVWGLSATPERADGVDIESIIGPIVCTIDRQELLDAGQLAHAKVVIHTVNQKDEIKAVVEEKAEPMFRKRLAQFGRMPNFNYQEQRNRCVWQVAQEIGIFTNPARDAKIIRLAREDHAEDSTLIIIGKIEHGERLAQGIPGAEIIHSKMGKKKRRAAIEGFQTGTLLTAIATSLADEGLDVPRANVLILAAGGRSARLAEQRTGRVLRSFKDKPHGTIHDFVDAQHPFLRAQSKARVKIYRELGYEIVVEGALV